MSGSRAVTARVAASLARVLPVEKSGRLFLASSLLVIAMGVTLRLVGYFGGIEFWWDEAMWAAFIADGRPAPYRPLGYFWVSRWLIDLRNTEPVIRSLSLLAGIFSLPAFLIMCRRAGLSRLVSLFGLFVLAVHPAAVDMTKEFKPYALELFLHVVLLALAFSFLRTSEWRWLAWTCAVAAISPLFAWSVGMLFPGLFVTLAVSAFRRRKIAQLLATIGATALTAGVSLTVFWVQVGRRRPRPGYLAEKYDVFSLASEAPGQLQWLLEKTLELASLPAKLESFWIEAGAAGVFAVLQVALFLLGLAAIGVARRWDWAGLWVSTWLVTILLNQLGRWPYGAFRANLYLLPYSLVVSLAGLDLLRRWTARSEAARGKARLIVPAYCAAFVLAFMPLDIGFFAEGKSSSMALNCHAHHALEVAYEAERGEAAPARQRRFLLDDYARDAYRYYVGHHAVASERYQDFFRERYRGSRRMQPLKEGIDKHAERGFWLLACRPGSTTELRQYVLDRCPQVDHLEEFRDGGLLLRCRVDGDRESS